MLTDADLTLGLRPLGNMKRLAKFGTYLCFRDMETARRYYRAWIQYARTHAPPRLIEVMLVFFGNDFVMAERFGLVHPEPDEEAEPELKQWILQCTRHTNGVVRFHDYTDGQYKNIGDVIDTVLDWDILVPEDFDSNRAGYQHLLMDVDDGHKILNTTPRDDIPGMPHPSGPEVGVVFEIQKMKEAVYSHEALRLLFRILDRARLASSTLRYGDIFPDCQHYCIAIRTPSSDAAEYVRRAVRSWHEEAPLPTENERIMEEADLSNQPLTFMGFVTETGEYLGIGDW
jgi:hypothetical protein